MQATVLYEKDTGHVFAVATVVAPLKAPTSDKPEEVTAALRAFAGTALPTRGYLKFNGSPPQPAKTEFTIPAQQLSVLVTDIEPGMLLEPKRYSVRDHKTVELSPSDPPPTLTLVGRNGLKVTLSQETLEELPVLLQVVPDSGVAGKAQTTQGAFGRESSTRKELTLPLSTPLAAGTHGVLMLIRGFRSGVRSV